LPYDWGKSTTTEEKHKFVFELGSDAAGEKKVYPGVDSLFFIIK